MASGNPSPSLSGRGIFSPQPASPRIRTAPTIQAQANRQRLLFMRYLQQAKLRGERERPGAAAAPPAPPWPKPKAASRWIPHEQIERLPAAHELHELREAKPRLPDREAAEPLADPDAAIQVRFFGRDVEQQPIMSGDSGDLIAVVAAPVEVGTDAAVAARRDLHELGPAWRALGERVGPLERD